MSKGDQEACSDARWLVTCVVTVVMKQAELAETCTGLDQQAAHRVGEAIDKARTCALRPYKSALPMTVTMRMRTMD